MSDLNGQFRSGFPATDWSLIQRAGQGSLPDRRELLGELLGQYVPALRAHAVMNRGLSRDEADDLVQSFVCNKVLEKDLIARVDQQRGRFRYFLVTALDRYLASERRARRARKRSPEEAVLHLQTGGDSMIDLPDDQVDPHHVFDQAWARAVLAQAIDRMRHMCDSTGRWDVWGVFEARVLAPALHGQEPMDYIQLVERFGLRSPAAASNILVTARRMFARILRQVIGSYAANDREIDLELHQLRAILGSV